MAPAVPRLDAFGDPLPPGAFARIGTARSRTVTPSAQLYSADGKLLVTTDMYRFVSLWDADGKELRRFRIPYGHPQPLALSPDARFLLLNSYGQSVFLWDVRTGKEVWGLGKDVPSSSGAFLADGKSLVVAAQRGAGTKVVPELVLRETATGKEIRRYEGGGGLVRLSPDGKTLAAGTSVGRRHRDRPLGGVHRQAASRIRCRTGTRAMGASVLSRRQVAGGADRGFMV